MSFEQMERNSPGEWWIITGRHCPLTTLRHNILYALRGRHGRFASHFFSHNMEEELREAIRLSVVSSLEARASRPHTAGKMPALPTTDDIAEGGHFLTEPEQTLNLLILEDAVIERPLWSELSFERLRGWATIWTPRARS
jgi:hypothetical protein